MRTTKMFRKPTILVVVGAVVLALGVTGVNAALGSRSSGSATPTRAALPTASTVPIDPVVVHPSPTSPVVSPSIEPTPDPNRLADGVYPTYVRSVDVQGATITIDVLQTFFGDDMRQAALEDGVAWKHVRYNPVYIRNENPLLRTIPVAKDVHIKFIGQCESPNRWVGLTQLQKEITPFTKIFYYDVTVVGDSVQRIEQLVSVAGC